LPNASDIKPLFAERIKDLRTAKSITSTALAKTVGVSPAAIWQWENAKAIPRSKTLSKVAIALGVTKGYLVGGAQSVVSARPLASAAPPIVPATTLEDVSLEDLIEAIQARGFHVKLRTI
jgi:transcriptional regulator with XRE-family HTH domain